ncbi:NDR1/HIN1-like protein 6 [Linum perenne]
MKPNKPNTSCIRKCICWTFSILLLLLIAAAASAAAIYLVFKPKVPNYSVDSLRISDLRLNLDLSLTARFDVRVTASNPNDKIGIYYESGGDISVWYSGTKLCRGPIPKFYQGHRNVTRLHVGLAGRKKYGSALMSAIQEQQTTGRIPLDLRVHAPVAVKLGALKMRKVKVLGNCVLVVDRLSSNNRINIKASDCKFKLKL